MNLFVAAIIAVALHEGAHALCAWTFDVRIKRIGANWRGVYLVREEGAPLHNMAIALAGPLMNLLATGSVFLVPWLGLRGCVTFAFVNFVLGFSNLIPFRGSDGWRVWQLLREERAA